MKRDMADRGDDELIAAASDGVQSLADTATAVLGQGGPVGALAQPVVDALRNVWEGYFGSPIPEDGTNWNSYTHQQLYDMLWQGADVGDVGDVAGEWERHGTELAGHAEGLREQRGSLERNWNGQAAQRAAGELGELGDRTSDIGARAGTNGQAVREAGDALAVARDEMPPPTDSAALTGAGTSLGTAAGTVIGGVLGAGAGGIGAAPGAMMGAAVGAVAGGIASGFLANVASAEQKAQAVHVMQTYEQSLLGSSRSIAATGATGAGGASGSAGQGEAIAGPASTSSAAFAGGSPTGGGTSGGGVPWGKLVGAGPLDAALPPGGRAGIGTAALRAAAAAGAGRGGGRGGMMPGGAAGRDRDDEGTEHRNRLPLLDQRLFEVDEPVMPPVIGE
ncbi:hypothetical protein BJ969_002113 [Saccharopolyspora gloriosae]|uniref:Outer membrane channel protein CpnT-like N-terminal domain-containing protein n=1 Tax=Saccharopolyspora gloriosae TaxID=455344 RepID=A0A840NG16_9PSEU|nr:hypothetical protein [Saccharopolyspora gloriosae]MBB5069025.1 hypothetical protein [Saccharopolyspora gloriosae]